MRRAGRSTVFFSILLVLATCGCGGGANLTPTALGPSGPPVAINASSPTPSAASTSTQKSADPHPGSLSVAAPPRAQFSTPANPSDTGHDQTAAEQVPPAATAGPACPNAETFIALHSSTYGDIVDTAESQCSGDWAAMALKGTYYWFVSVIHYTGGEWVAADKTVSCPAGEIPADLYKFACETAYSSE